MSELEPQHPERLDPVVIRDINPAPGEFEQTVAEMVDLHNRAFGEDMVVTAENIGDRLKHALCIGAYLKNKLVGDFGVTTKSPMWPDSWYLFGMAVDPQTQGKGIGDKLIKEALRRGGENQKYTATARPNNYGSIALCVNNNHFRITKFLRNHFGPDKHRVLMESSPQLRNSELEDDIVKVSSSEIEALEEKLQTGYIGIGIERGPDPEQDSETENPVLLLRKVRNTEA